MEKVHKSLGSDLIITRLDAVECEMTPESANTIANCLQYPRTIWVQTPFGKREKRVNSYLFTSKSNRAHRTYTGLIPRIQQWCNKNEVPLQIIGEDLRILPQRRPSLPGITLRPDQISLILAATKSQRGVVSAATGSGKTIVQLGFLSRYPENTAVILAHTTAIVRQTYEKMLSLGFKDVEMLGAGEKFTQPSKQYTIATMQSFKTLDPKHYADFYDIVLVDECHRAMGKEATYDQILKNMLAPIRLGFTATPATDKQAVLVTEGLMGPIIHSLSINKAASLGILAKPKLKLIRAENPTSLRGMTNYQDVYNQGIVENKARNRQIAKLAESYVSQGKTVLIFVIQIAHGKRISEALRGNLSNETPFIQGSVPLEEREHVKKALISGKIKCCIATISWLEGVDIPNLDVVILASLGKAEIRTLQGIGRGLRKTKDKDEVVIIDFLDLDHRHLTNHTGERLAVYSKMDWL